jgi:hypothetical protein
MRQVRHEQTLWPRGLLGEIDQTRQYDSASRGVVKEAAAVTDVDPPAQAVSEQESCFDD